MASKRLKLVLAAAGVVLSAGVLSFGPLVRYEVAEAGARHGLRISVGKVRPAWGGVKLEGVDVSAADVPAAHAHVDEVRVSFEGGGRHIAVRGGHVEAVGPRDEIVAQVDAWRAKNARPRAEGGGGAATSRDALDLGGFSVRWRDRADAPTEAVSATGVRVDRKEDRLEVSADAATVQHGAARFEATRGLVRVRRVDGALRVHELTLAALDGSWVLEAPGEARDADDPAAAPSSSQAAPAASTKAAAPAAKGGATPRSKGTVTTPARDTLAWERRIRRGAEALTAAAKAIDGLLEDDAKIAIERVHARVARGADSLHVGPGRLTVGRDAGRLVVELSPWASAAEKPADGSRDEQAITFRLGVPVRDDAASQEIEGDVRGGPIWLSTLGIKDGDFGLFDVNRAALTMNARVTLSGDRASLRVSGDGKLTALSVSNEALSDEPIAGLDLAWRGKAVARLDRRRVEVEEGEVDLGQIRVLTVGSYERTGDDHRLRASIDVPLVGCQPALDSLPKGLVSRVSGVRMAGTFALKGKVAFDTARLERDFSLSWDTAVSCRVTEAPPSIDVSRFTRPFERTVYTPEGLPRTIESGPGTPGWAAYGAISKFMSVAVLTTEDGGFYRHRGFDAEAIKNSLRENLKKRRFVRGASTISMQLAKNLYLDRAKNVARKLQEAVLTMYLEQALTKDQILELYLNVVELGPMVYGVGPAAQHHFRTDPGQLSLGQALHLSSILPNPKVDHFTPQGPVRPSWMAYLHKLMEVARKRERITDEELEEGLRETVVRGSPAPFRAPKPEAPAGDPSAASGEVPDEPAWTAP